MVVHAETIYQTWATVTITGTRDLFASDSGGLASFWVVRAGVYGGGYGTGPRLEAGDLMDLKNEVAQILLDKTTTTDIRCNIAPTMNDFRNVTSQSDSLQRWQAAEALAEAIRVVDTGRSIRKLASRNAPMRGMDGVMRLSFSVTYADGGKEVYAIDTLVSAPMLQDASAKMLSPGDGNPTPCPN